MKNNTAINELIQSELRRGGNPSQVARRFGISYQALLNQKRMTSRTGFANETVVPEPDDISTLAREGLEPFVIAIKRTNEPEWPEKYWEMIEDARKKYDAGTHEMFTGRKNGWFVLYLQPRLFPVRSRNYFKSMFEFG